MTLAKTTAFGLALAGALALGVWIGPYVIDRDDVAIAGQSESRAATATASARPAAPAARRVVVPASAPDLHKRLQPVLNEGTNLTIAAEGFRDGEQFAEVAHAARNTGAPFMVLKHRVLEERKSLASAIRELKPELDAAKEANRARIMARADIAAIAM